MARKFRKVFVIAVIKVALLSFSAAIPLKSTSELNDQNISFEDKPFDKYAEELRLSLNHKNYFAAIFQDDKIRDDFIKFLNEGLTQQAKDDLAGLRIYKKVGDAEVPVVMFSSQMDSWLGILPQWKRTKRYMFKRVEDYLLQHPQVLRQFNQNVN